jgi:hypothetical protein
MRLTLALVVAFVVAACAVGQSASERDFVRGDGARSAQASLDAAAIMQGMAQARDASQRVARDVPQGSPVAAPAAVTR